MNDESYCKQFIRKVCCNVADATACALHEAAGEIMAKIKAMYNIGDSDICVSLPKCSDARLS